jgi:hypothetical protein
MLATLE